MPRVIRYGQKKKPGGDRWSDAQILMAAWELEEQLTGKPSPMKRAEMQLEIPELKPIPRAKDGQPAQEN